MTWRGLRRRPVALARRRRAWHLVALVVICLLDHPAAQCVPNRTSRATAPSVMTADTVVYDTQREIVTATGDVEISTGQRRLLADEVRYDQRTGKVFAIGNVVLIEPSGDALFGDEVELDDEFREGFATGVGILLEDDSRIAATQATRREGNRIELDRAVYSPCPLCDDGKGSPLWQIKARRVIWDQDGPDGELPRCAAGDVRPADRLHALFPPSGAGGEAPVRLSHADLRQHLRTRRWSRRSPTISCSTKAPTSPSRRSSRRTPARC